MNHSFNVQIACIYDERCAILIQHFDHWLTKNAAEKNSYYYHEGTYWTKCTIPGLHKIFPYISKDQLKRTLKKLKDKEVITSKQFNEDKNDRTNWYTFTKKFLKSPCKESVQFALIMDGAKSPHVENRTKSGSQKAKNLETPVSLDGAKSPDHGAKSPDVYNVKYVIKDVINNIKDHHSQNSDLWTSILLNMEKQMKRSSFNTWLKPTQLLNRKNGCWTLGVPDDVFEYWIKEHYLVVLQEEVKAQTKECPEFMFTVVDA
jgi:hypothetical protein